VKPDEIGEIQHQEVAELSEENTVEHESVVYNGEPRPQDIATLEALLFASGEELPLRRLAEVAGLATSTARATLAALADELAMAPRGVELVEVAGKYLLRTKAVCAPAVRLLKAAKPKRLSAAALETLAVIAYRQPIVKSDIEKIRGVDSSPTLKTLLDRGLIKIAGQQATVGQPALYGTTEEFLKIFGLKSLPELPSLREFVMFARENGEEAERC
jgi:segregation and condensation protein B